MREDFVRIKKDPFHFMKSLDKFIPKQWSHKLDFYRDLSSTLFTLNPEDIAAVVEVCNTALKCSLEDRLNDNSDWVWARVRRHIPRPAELAARLRRFWEKWGKVPNEQGTGPLFDEDAEHIFNLMIQTVELDQVSDPPGISLYRVLKTDVYGLTMYSCQRGTNQNESVHNKINEGLVTENCSVELADHLFSRFVYVHNQKAAIRNKPGTRDHGHYELDLVDKINELHMDLAGRPKYPNYTPATRFALTGETTGVVRVVADDATRRLLADTKPWEKYTGSIKYLSERTGSAVPVMPVQYPEERTLFSKMKPNYVNREHPNKIDFSKMVSDWNTKIDGVTIFPKNAYHLELHYKAHAKALQRWERIREMVQRGFKRDEFISTTDPSVLLDMDTDADQDQQQHDDEFADHNLAPSTTLEPAPHVPSAIMGNRLAHPIMQLNSTQPQQQRVPTPRTRNCSICRQPCPGSSLKTRCPQYIAPQPSQEPGSQQPPQRNPTSAPAGPTPPLYHGYHPYQYVMPPPYATTMPRPSTTTVRPQNSTYIRYRGRAPGSGQP